MIRHDVRKTVRWLPEDMFAIVADIEAYPEFLPWCSGARVYHRSRSGKVETLEAELTVSFKVITESYRSRVTLDPENLRIGVANLGGLFRTLESGWAFRRVASGCEIDFFIEFEFKSAVLGRVMGLMFDRAMRRMVAAFEDRAEAIYGWSTGETASF